MIFKRDHVRAMDFGSLRVLDYTVDVDSNSSMAVVNVPPGSRHREAYSTRCEKYYFIAKGEVEFAIDGVYETLQEGDGCLVRVGQRFQYKNVSDGEASLLVVHTPRFDSKAEIFTE